MLLLTTDFKAKEKGSIYSFLNVNQTPFFPFT